MLFEQDIKKQRAQVWRTAENARPLRTLDDAREFLNSVGFCLAYPVKPAVLAPTFIGAYSVSEEKLPTARQAFADANARAATEFVVRLLSEKSAFEIAFGDDGSLLVSAAEFPYFYALVGDRNPKVAPSPGLRNEQALTTHTFEVIDQNGPINEDDMRRKLGREVSRNAIEKVLHALWSKLRITRVDSGIENGEPAEPVWDLMHRWTPELVNRGKQISAAEALSALISKYLETVIAAEQKEVEEFFGHLVPRSKVTEVCKALLAAREFTYVQVSGKTMLRLASRGGDEESASTAPEVEPAARKPRPWQARVFAKKAAEEKGAPFARRPNLFPKFSKDRNREESGERRLFTERKSAHRDFDQQAPRRSESAHDNEPFAGKPKFGERKPFGQSKNFADNPHFGKERAPRRDVRPEQKREGAERNSFNARPKPFGERKNFGGKNRPSHKRERFSQSGEKRGGESRRGGGDHRKDFKGDYRPRRDNDKANRSPKVFGNSFGGKKSSDERKSFGKPFGPRKSFGAKKPFTKSFDKRKPASGERPPWLRDKKPPREGPAE